MRAPKPPLELLIAAPRGFCAGVDRAIRIVELALAKHGAPVFVRDEIQGAKRVEGHLINRLVRQRMIDGLAAVLGLVASSTSGLIKEAVVWITDETQDLSSDAP